MPRPGAVARPGVMAALMETQVQEYQRICPVCETSNPPDQPLCACGASLASVDFTLKTSPAAMPEVVPAVAPSAATLVCPYGDCAQPNPPGTERCLYCNRPLRETAPGQGASHRFTLPQALRDDYRIVEDFPASGSEADLLLVESRHNGERLVAKLYRKGVQPDSALLARLSQNPAGHVVRLITYGQSDGYTYELMEYCPHGTLRQILDSGPQPRERLRRMVAEMAAGVSEIHAQRILHRDLKPENFLVRASDPLQLALTDFGIASLRQATQHFTTLARSVKYAAPEALTGMLDEKADWWSLGMIMLEAATGQHPFDGLSDQVINHHLATRPLDVSSVFDDDLRKLCRGLLLRDPKRRWGGAEVARWLDGDVTLQAPEESQNTASVRPYRIGTAECTTAAGLALALARNWEDGSKDLKRGDIGAWLTEQLNDRNLARKLQDILDLRGVSDSYRLLRFLLAAAPDMPAVWRGKPASREAIIDMARTAAAGDKEAQEWLESIFSESALEAFAEAGKTDAGELGHAWRKGWERFRELWESAHHAEVAWRTTPKSMDGDASSAYVDIDDVMYSRPLRLAQPSRRSMNARLLLVLHDASMAELMRAEVLAGQGELAGLCPWFDALGDIAVLDPVGVLVARQLLPLARDDATQEKQRLGGYGSNREQNIATVRNRVQADLRAILEIAKRQPLDLAARLDLSRALAKLQETSQWALRLGYPEENFRKLMTIVEQVVERAFSAEEALHRLESIETVNSIFLQPNRLALAAVILAFCYAASPWLTLIGGFALTVFGILRMSAATRAREAMLESVRSLTRLGAALPSNGQ